MDKKIKMQKRGEIKEPRAGDKKKNLLTAIILILLIVNFVIFIYTPKCDTQDCFINALIKCKKSSFINKQEDSVWSYIIKGISNKECIVHVKNIYLKMDVETTKELQRKEMVCRIPMDIAGSFMPQSKIEYCGGELKESIQDLMIKKMHLFIIQNIGEINRTLSPI